MKKLLVIRFSALGDVALTAPVIQAVLEQNEDIEITFLGRGFMQAVFPAHPRFKFYSADLNGKHKGPFGLRKLAKELKQYQFDAVIDLHDVLRTKFLCTLLKSRRCPVYKIDKERKLKKAIINKEVPLQQLKHSTQRYLEVFQMAGIKATIGSGPYLNHQATKRSDYNLPSDIKCLGIAPYAAHETKEWGEERILELLGFLADKNIQVYFFGGGSFEQQRLQQFAEKFDHCTSLVGRYKLAEELAIMSTMDCMLTMDSGNMHLAALVGTPVVSIWGATHPALGFAPLNNEQNIVQIPVEQLDCRPCTIYGPVKTIEQQACAQASMDLITQEMVWEKLKVYLD